MNTFFEHLKGRFYTWKSPNDTVRNQVDFIMIKNRFKNSFKDIKTYPGADIDSDHNPVVSKVEIKLKKIRRFNNIEKLDVSKLRDYTTKTRYAIEVNDKFERLNSIEPVNEMDSSTKVERKFEHI